MLLCHAVAAAATPAECCPATDNAVNVAASRLLPGFVFSSGCYCCYYATLAVAAAARLAECCPATVLGMLQHHGWGCFMDLYLFSG